MGGLLTADGHAVSEVLRRIGAATGDFRALQKMWGHASIGKKRKLQLLHALVASKLQYSLSTLWLVSAQLRRIDGFYARCIRPILGIPASFVSRVSNTSVFAKARLTAMSEQVKVRQLVLMGKVARSPGDSPLRRDVFVGNTLNPQVGRYIRRVGRPRQEWCTEVLKVGASKFGSHAQFEAALAQAETLYHDQLEGKFRRSVSR